MGDNESSGKRGEPRCSFCSKAHHEVLKIIAGPEVFICNECVTICNEILDNDEIPLKAARTKENERQHKVTPEQREVWDLQCSICSKWQSEGVRLIAGPQSYICGECVEKCALVLADRKPVGKIVAILERESEARCSFCEKRAVEVSGVVGDGRTHICQECVEHCCKILAE